MNCFKCPYHVIDYDDSVTCDFPKGGTPEVKGKYHDAPSYCPLNFICPFNCCEHKSVEIYSNNKGFYLKCAKNPTIRITTKAYKKQENLAKVWAKLKKINDEMSNKSVKDLVDAAHKLCEGCQYIGYRHNLYGCYVLTNNDCLKKLTPEMKAALLEIETNEREIII